MTLGFVLAIIFIGLLLVFLEIFLIPGTTLFGIIGGLALVIGVALMYSYYGSLWGHITTASVLVLLVVAVVAGFRVIQSNKLAMKAEITGKVNELEANSFNLGDQGNAVTDLRPGGKAIINGQKTDVYSQGDFIPRDSNVEIIKITNDKIFVTLSKS